MKPVLSALHIKQTPCDRDIADTRAITDSSVVAASLDTG